MADILNKDYTVNKIVRAKPICGEDFCAHCSNCLECYGNQACTNVWGHRWVVYAEEVEEFYNTHEVKE